MAAVWRPDRPKARAWRSRCGCHSLGAEEGASDTQGSQGSGQMAPDRHRGCFLCPWWLIDALLSDRLTPWDGRSDPSELPSSMGYSMVAGFCYSRGWERVVTNGSAEHS